MEPVELDALSLKCMIVRGQAEQTWSALAALLEFLTDLAPEKIVLPQSKTVEDISAFEESLKNMNSARGRRVTVLSLPPQWSIHGVFHMQYGKDESIEIVHRYRGVSVPLPDAFAFEAEDDLHIENTHAERRAQLRAKNSLDEDACLLLPLFRDQHPDIDWNSPWSSSLKSLEMPELSVSEVSATPMPEWCPPPPK